MSKSQSIAGSRRARRKVAWGAIGLVTAYWLFWLFGLIAQSALRGKGDEVFSPTNLRTVEASIFGAVPAEWLQRHVQSRDIVALDFFGFMNHVLWFPLPQVMGIALSRKARPRLIEFFLWIVTLALASGVVFLLFPVVPPWMDGGSQRVLVERAFTDYTKADNNPVAAFPSMHAAVPFLMGIYFWTRCREDGRPLAWLCLGYSITVGFSVVYLGEHWLLDVLAGYALAGGIAWFYLSGSARKVSRLVPGDPFGSLIALNQRILGEKTAFTDQQQSPAPLEEPLPRAA